MKIKPTDSAFPGIAGESGAGNSTQSFSPDGGGVWVNHNQGLTKREFFAAMALQGILSSEFPTIAQLCKGDIETLSVQHADDLISALNKS